MDVIAAAADVVAAVDVVAAAVNNFCPRRQLNEALWKNLHWQNGRSRIIEPYIRQIGVD